ncbi:MAG TPA: AMP-binding protein, partial [Chondromyces sp.]|nr:AMP-binding protein [Chondromyces sp.]
MPDRTVLDLFRYDVEAPRREHYTHWFPGGRTSYSTEDFMFHTASLADALAELGVAAGDRVALASDNRPEWHMADLATLDLGAVDVPVYPSLTAEQLHYQLRDSGAVVAVVEDAAQAAKLAEVRERCPELQHVVQIDGAREDGVLSFSELVEGGDAIGSEKRFWDR